MLCFGQGCRWPNLPIVIDVMLSPPWSSWVCKPVLYRRSPAVTVHHPRLARGAQTAGSHQVTPQLLLKVKQAGGTR